MGGHVAGGWLDAPFLMRKHNRGAMSTVVTMNFALQLLPERLGQMACALALCRRLQSNFPEIVFTS